jgi:hypothetical protein
MTYDWSFFDKIYCINLVTRNDRKINAQSIFDKYNIPAEFYTVEKHPEGGTIGCFNSHASLIRHGYNKGYKNMLIFEDDIEDTNSLTPDNLRKSTDFMKDNNSWDLFYLGAFPEINRHVTKKMGNSIYSLHSICTHAYVINRKYMEKLKNLQWSGVEIDYLYLKNAESYASYPTLFIQGVSKSDLGSSDFWNLCPPGIKRSFFRLLEFYAYYINIRMIHLSRILLLLFILFFLINAVKYIKPNF